MSLKVFFRFTQIFFSDLQTSQTCLGLNSNFQKKYLQKFPQKGTDFFLFFCENLTIPSSLVFSRGFQKKNFNFEKKKKLKIVEKLKKVS